jgi:cold shock protein
LTGTVKWLNAAKGHGFITRNGSGDDVFVHISALERSGLERSGLMGLSEGDRVVVNVIRSGKGFEAASVRLRKHGALFPGCHIIGPIPTSGDIDRQPPTKTASRGKNVA